MILGSGVSSYVFGVGVRLVLLVYCNMDLFCYLNCVVVISRDGGGSSLVLWVYWYSLFLVVFY